ncbi:inactive serine protease 45-like [Penaeus monodon]|uniref:inactive serine protease 45-like n=1 Tax=Penaeus monodon TaxID=6687 RepID=UPI0018A716BF|nr:inactive serine protease 45-like [Penaeus monodon]
MNEILLVSCVLLLASANGHRVQQQASISRGILQGRIKMGMLPEDSQIAVRSTFPNIQTALPETTPMDIARNTIEDMMGVVEMEDPKDPLMGGLKAVMKDVKESQQKQQQLQQLQVSTRQAGSEEAMADSFEDRVRVLLSASGVETVLPFDCGRNPQNPENPLEEPPLPWIAALGSREDGRFHYRCTGAVISRFHILTDADCVASPNINLVQFNVSRRVPDPNAILNYVVGRRIHPMVKETEDLLSGYNVGLLELAFPVQFNEYIQPVCLPGIFETAEQEKQEPTHVVGFNDISDTSQGRIATLYSVGNSTTFGPAGCQILIKAYNERYPNHISNLFSVITKNHVCVNKFYDQIGKSVVLRESVTTGRVQLVGVSGVANARLPIPIAYTQVQPHRFWIELVLKKFKDNTSSRTLG